MSTRFFTPATQKIFSMGNVLKKGFLKQVHALDQYTRLPIEKQFEKLLRYVKGSPCILLHSDGTILSWNKTFERLKGYCESEILGQNFSIFYLPLDRQAGLPQLLIDQAKKEGRAKHIGRRVRKDGTIFWGSILITALHDEERNVVGFTKLTKELRDNEID